MQKKVKMYFCSTENCGTENKEIQYYHASAYDLKTKQKKKVQLRKTVRLSDIPHLNKCTLLALACMRYF